MKKAFLLFNFLPLISFAQEVAPKPTTGIAPMSKNEFGINLFSVTRIDDFFMHDWVDRIDFNPPGGVFYKRHFGNNAFRTSFDFTHKSRMIGEPPVLNYYNGSNGNYYNTKRDNVAISVGYERYLGLPCKFQPFVFTDLVMNYEHEYGERVYWGEFNPQGVHPLARETFEFGIAIGGGLRYNLTSKFNLVYEISGQGYLSYTNDLLFNRPGVNRYISSSGFHFNPVNKLGISFSF
ncbi:MAG: hypothetical protein M3R17_05045 [Bacteroidota bacterium]|nr:hypothetical protein [Bacteroidota bacterium]